MVNKPSAAVFLCRFSLVDETKNRQSEKFADKKRNLPYPINNNWYMYFIFILFNLLILLNYLSDQKIKKKEKFKPKVCDLIHRKKTDFASM